MIYANLELIFILGLQFNQLIAKNPLNRIHTPDQVTVVLKVTARNLVLLQRIERILEIGQVGYLGLYESVHGRGQTQRQLVVLSSRSFGTISVADF